MPHKKRKIIQFDSEEVKSEIQFNNNNNNVTTTDLPFRQQHDLEKSVLDLTKGLVENVNGNEAEIKEELTVSIFTDSENEEEEEEEWEEVLPLSSSLSSLGPPIHVQSTSPRHSLEPRLPSSSSTLEIILHHSASTDSNATSSSSSKPLPPQKVHKQKLILHQVHFLCNFAHAHLVFLNAWNSQLQNVCLALLPKSLLKYHQRGTDLHLQPFLTWFNTTFQKNLNAPHPTHALDFIHHCLKTHEAHPATLRFLLYLFLLALDIPCTFVVLFSPVSLKSSLKPRHLHKPREYLDQSIPLPYDVEYAVQVWHPTKKEWHTLLSPLSNSAYYLRFPSNSTPNPVLPKAQDITAEVPSSKVKWAARLPLFHPWLKETLNSLVDETQILTQKGFPIHFSDYQQHPMYALERYLTLHQTIFPKSPILAKIRGEPIYPRSHVHQLHSKGSWLRKFGLNVKSDSDPIKKLKSLKTGREKLLFGLWQTEPFIAPSVDVVNEILPKNQFGNIEIFHPCMIPNETVHLKCMCNVFWYLFSVNLLIL
ncbi:DNA repair protein rad4 [Coelomomyces lativittatus]|nr:DNA repair protein rad4 [Coelomomyces lativittatus]